MIRSLKDLEVTGKRVFCRLDLNVPLSEQENGTRKIEDDTRIREALPSLKYLIEKGARIIVGSHLGRPNGKKDPKYSLEPIGLRLAELLGQEVIMAEACMGEAIELLALGLKNGQVMLLENLRFSVLEEKNDLEFARKLARLAQVYVNDAFGTAHRKHASTYALPELMHERGMGFLIEKELKFLDPLIKGPQRPFIVLLGGAKVTDKIQTIEMLMRRLDALLIGGAMAHSFWVASGKELPSQAKIPRAEDVLAAKELLALAKKRNIRLELPVDMIDACDIGPVTLKSFQTILSTAKCIFWNGPLGWFEKPPYEKGTFEMARFMAGLQDCVKVVGGGDTVSAIYQSGQADHFEHLSTGGGAVLEYLEGKGLVGIDVLKLSAREREQLHIQEIEP